MAKNVLNYSSTNGSALQRHNLGIWLGRICLIFCVAMTLAAIIWILAIPFLAIACASGLGGLLLTKGRSRCAWIAIAVMFLYVAAGLIYGSIVARSQQAALVPMLPQGFKSPTFYSKPQIDPVVAASVDMTGIYFQGKLEGLRVDRVTPDSHLGRDYRLLVGDEIIPAAGWSFDDGEPLDVAKARALSNTPNNLSLTVVRGGKAFYISPGDPPHELPPGRVTIHSQ